jgi:NTP pyrophosphatase (non-canonical NTP hydrolase)
MEMNRYQVATGATAIYETSSRTACGSLGPLLYTVLGLVGEGGEFANKLKKILRDKNGVIDEDTRIELRKELGDCLWYISEAATQLGTTLDIVADENVKKLQRRKEKGTLQGSGDSR